MASIPELLGGWLGGTQDAEGNRCLQDKVCGPDNIKFSEGMRTLFVGEDTSRRNNNYVWAFNVDTRKLSRILSVPMYAEATGLQVVDDANGFSYVMSNFQHPGEQSQVGTFKGVKDADRRGDHDRGRRPERHRRQVGRAQEGRHRLRRHGNRSAPGHPVASSVTTSARNEPSRPWPGGLSLHPIVAGAPRRRHARAAGSASTREPRGRR